MSKSSDRRLFGGLGGGAALLIVGVLALPTILSWTGYTRTLGRTLLPNYPGKIEIGSGTLSWISPVSFREVVLTDLRGEPLATIPEITTNKSLLGFLFDRANIGTVRLVRPEIVVGLRETGSNLEDVLEPLLRGEASTVAGTIDLYHGTIRLREVRTGQETEFDDVTASIAFATDGKTPVTGTVESVITTPGLAPQAGATGRIKGAFTWHPSRGTAASGTWVAGLGAGEVTVDAEAVPTRALASLLARYGVPIPAVRAATGRIGLAWDETTGQQQATFQNLLLADVTVRDGLTPTGSFAAPAALGGTTGTAPFSVASLGPVTAPNPTATNATPPITLATVGLNGSAALGRDVMQVSGLRVATEFGDLTATGGLPLAGWDTPAMAERLAGSNLTAKGTIDLARLANRYPEMLALQPGTRITGGRIDVTLVSRAEGRDAVLVGELASRDVTVEQQGRPVRLAALPTATFTIRPTANGPVLERIACESNFLTVSGSGSLTQGEVNVQADLAKLRQDWANVIDFGSVRLAGQANGRIRWTTSQDGRRGYNCEGKIVNLDLAAPGQLDWKERELTGQIQLIGPAGGIGLGRLDAGQATLVSGQDSLRMTLLEPVATPSLTSPLPVRIDLAGDLATWMPRLQAVLPVAGYQTSGMITSAAAGTVAWGDVRLTSSETTVENLRVIGSGLNVQEKKVRLSASGAWNRTKSRFESKQAQFVSSTVAFESGDVFFSFDPQTPGLGGELSLRGNLAKVEAWLTPPTQEIKKRLRGDFLGSLRLTPVTDGIRARIDVDATGLALDSLTETPTSPQTAARPGAANTNGPSVGQAVIRPVSYGAPAWQTIWEEGHGKIAGTATLKLDRRELILDDLVVQGTTGAAILKGRITELGRRNVADLTGRIQFVMDTVATRLRPFVSQDLAFVGGTVNTIEIRGPLWEMQTVTSALPASNTGGPAGLVQADRFTPGLGGGSVTASRPSPGWFEAGRPAGGTTPVSANRTDPALSWLSPDLTAKTSADWTAIRCFGFESGEGRMTAQLRNGQLVLDLDKMTFGGGKLRLHPIVTMEGGPVSLQFRSDQGVDNVAQNIRFTPELCNKWMKYVSPLAAGATQAEGVISARIADGSIPVAHPERMTLAGDLIVQDAKIGLTPLTRELILIARRIGAIAQRKDPSTILTSINDFAMTFPPQAIGFHVKDGAVYHHGATIQVDRLTMETRGYVGFDESINLIARVPIDDKWIDQNKDLASLRGKDLLIPIRGTLSRPVPDASDALRQLSQMAIQNVGQSLLEDGLRRGLNQLIPGNR